MSMDMMEGTKSLVQGVWQQKVDNIGFKLNDANGEYAISGLHPEVCMLEKCRQWRVQGCNQEIDVCSQHNIGNTSRKIVCTDDSSDNWNLGWFMKIFGNFIKPKTSCFIVA